MLLKNGSFYYEKRLVPGDLRVTGETIEAFSPRTSEARQSYRPFWTFTRTARSAWM